MADFIRAAAVAALCGALLVAAPVPTGAQTQSSAQIDAATWGLYARLAGSERQSPESFRVRWHWSEPGRALVEEYFKPGNDKPVQTGTITPGASAGTLVLKASTFVGDKVWNGTVQPDGSVVFVGTGLLKFHYKAVLASDGAYELRPVKMRNGAVASVAEPGQFNRYLPMQEAETSAAAIASSLPPAAASVDRASATTLAAEVANQPMDLPDIQIRWGMLPQLIGPAYRYEDPMGFDAAIRFEWIEPGKSLRVLSQNGGPWHEFYRFVPTSEPSKFATVYAEEGYSPSTATVLSDGRIAFGYGTAWVLVDGLLHEQYSDGTDLRVYYPDTPEGLARRPPNKRTPPRWLTMSPEERAAESRAAMAEIDSDAEAQRMAKAAAWEAQAGQTRRELDESLQNLNNTVANIQAQQQYKRQQGDVQTYSNQEVQNARAATERQYEIGRQLDATRQATTADSAISAQSSAGAVQQSNAPGNSLRFVLSIGLQPRAGDSVNPTCYSNVITRAGPPGWGQRGFLPPGSAQAAQAEVQGMKSRFIAACRAASGREVTSEGDFHWTWNELRDGEAQIANTHAQYREDVTVSL